MLSNGGEGEILMTKGFQSTHQNEFKSSSSRRTEVASAVSDVTGKEMWTLTAFVTVAMVYVCCLFHHCITRNWTTLAHDSQPKNRYIYIYRCSWVSPNRDERAGNPYKKFRANPGADRKNIQKIYNIHVRSTRPLIVQIYTVRLAPLCTGVFLYVAGAAMPSK